MPNEPRSLSMCSASEASPSWAKRPVRCAVVDEDDVTGCEGVTAPGRRRNGRRPIVGGRSTSSACSDVVDSGRLSLHESDLKACRTAKDPNGLVLDPIGAQDRAFDLPELDRSASSVLDVVNDEASSDKGRRSNVPPASAGETIGGGERVRMPSHDSLAALEGPRKRPVASNAPGRRGPKTGLRETNVEPVVGDASSACRSTSEKPREASVEGPAGTDTVDGRGAV